MSRITFNFKLEKLVHALGYFSKNGTRNLTRLKATKLLHFADKERLLRRVPGVPVEAEIIHRHRSRTVASSRHLHRCKGR
jgi:hypothetical protein